MNAYLAAQQGIGAGQVARIVRYREDGTRCTMNNGRHAEWNWAYEIVPPIPCAKTNPGRMHLSTVRNLAAVEAEFVVEDWQGGRTFRRGPKGGLTAIEARQ